MLHECSYPSCQNRQIYFVAIHMAIVDNMAYSDAFLWSDDVTKTNCPSCHNKHIYFAR